MASDGSATADWYDRATRDLAGHSALHVAWATGVRDDPEVLAVLDRLPRERRQPSLVFSVATLLGAPIGGYPGFREWLLAHADRLVAEASRRRTQTNEVGRCAPLVAALASIAEPIALLEVGASAGLCLLPDRYRYRFSAAAAEGVAPGGDGAAVDLGDGDPLVECVVSGVGATPRRLPDIVWRRGLDLDPLHPETDAAWLEALIPADRPDRRARLRAALATARSDPPEVVGGDALAGLDAALAGAPADAELVVASLGTLVYLAPEARAAFPDAVRDRGARLVALEGRGVLPRVAERRARLDCPDPTGFVLSLDEEPIADVAPHGDRMSWLSGSGHRGGAGGAA